MGTDLERGVESYSVCVEEVPDGWLLSGVTSRDHIARRYPYGYSKDEAIDLFMAHLRETLPAPGDS